VIKLIHKTKFHPFGICHIGHMLPFLNLSTWHWWHVPCQPLKSNW
jgi:hypothetical protein